MIGNFVEVKKAKLGPGRQGQSPDLYRRCRDRRGRQYRRRHDHLQLRRLRQVPDRDRRGRLHRLEQRAGRAGDDRRRRDVGAGQRHHRGRRRPTRWRCRARRSRSDKPGCGRASASRDEAHGSAKEARRARARCAESSASSARRRSRERLVDGLRRLEYRGYDWPASRPLDDGEIERRRAEGKLDNLARELAREPLARHDRHRPHPLGDARRADREQRASARRRRRRRRPQRHHRELQAAARRADRRRPHASTAETDTEVVAHLVAEQLERGHAPEEAVARGAAAAARRLRARHPLPRRIPIC